ncbi:unnamed protein product [Phyllotreta striolata]|uniref:Uncharacterized protein n=1 Tax=Phyllotreta striolata TaxID=444603 RepID=A0A9N9XNF1_PHYSR|nr:unnamed protein product [Phyllotreta striolata]
MALLQKIRPFFRWNAPTLSRMLARHLESASAETPTSENYNFEDKVAVVTGGASGIGFAITRELLRSGVTAVNIIDIDQEKLVESEKVLKDEFGNDRVITYKADVADTEQMDTIFRNTSQELEKIDIIVNNAGILDDTNWEAQLDTNIRGSVIGTLLGMQYLSKSSSGHGGVIVNLGSCMSIVPASGFPIHTLTQFGIAGFTRALGTMRLYQRTGVKVFGYCPSFTNTNALKNLEEKTINANFAEDIEEQMKTTSLQDPENVAKGLVEILEVAKPGSIWIVENNESPFELEFPKFIPDGKSDEKESEQSATTTTEAQA